MAKKDIQDPWVPSLTNESRLLQRLLKDAIPHEWVADACGRTLKFANPLRASEFCEAMMRRGDEGYAAGARFFMAAVVEGRLERAICSHLLTKMAKSFRDLLCCDRETPLLEQEVAFFGRFIRHLQQEVPQTVVDWIEDMNVDDSSYDLKPQPTALIRGVLLSPAIEQRYALSFWEKAAAAKHFPLRIFSDPCDAHDGTIFSSYHLRAFGAVFALVSTSALERFTKHMRERTLCKLFLANIGEGKWVQLPVPVQEYERHSAFDSIVGHIEAPARRQEVADLLGVSDTA